MTRLRVDRRVGLLLGGILLMTFVALGASVALPASDAALRAKGGRLSRLEAHGMEVYRAEGCWYCHTRYVRNTAADATLGEPLAARAYSDESPAMLGMERIGPDLTHLGSRYADSAELIEFLRESSANVTRTSMPSYAYLGEADLRALAAYLLSLR